MTLVETYLPFGIRDVKITPFIGEIGVGLPVDLPVGRVVTFREVEEVELLKSDDRNVAMEGKGPIVEWELEAGGISFEAWQVLSGASLVTGAGFRELVKFDTDVRPYFVIEGQSINDDGTDLHVILRRCKVNGSIEGSFSEGQFFVTQCEGVGIGDSTGELWRMRWNDRETEIFAGVKLIPNVIRIQARPMNVLTGEVIGAILTPASLRMEAQPLAISLGTEVSIALQPATANLQAQALSVSGGVGAVTIAPASVSIQAQALVVHTGINLMPAVVQMQATPLIVGASETIIQAESGTVEGGALVVTDNPGYTGTGYIGYFGVTGDVNEIGITVPSAVTAPFSIRFGNAHQPASDTMVNIRVNGSIQGSITLPNTASDWSDPNRFQQSSVINIPLVTGVNIIRIEHAGLEYTYADLDSYTIGAGGGGGTPSNPPIAEFSMFPSAAQVGQIVQFTDQTANVPTGWDWDFGDGAGSTQQNPQHAYSGAATYDVELIATNAQGSDGVIHSIIVTSGGGGGTPDYVVGVHGSLQQILELPYSDIAGKRVLVPTGLWQDYNGLYIVNKDFGGAIVEFQAGAILRGYGNSGIEMYGEIKNITFVGPGIVEANASMIDANGLFMDSARTDKGANGNPNGNITIDGLTFQPIDNVGRIGRSGCSIWGGENYTIRNVTVRKAADNAAYGFGGAGSGMSFGHSRTTGFGLPSHGYRLLIENCSITDCMMEDGNESADRNGIILDLWHGEINPRGDHADRSHGPAMIRNNFVKDVSGSGIHVLVGGRADSPITIRDNRVEGAYGQHMDGPRGYGIGSFGFESSGYIDVTNNDVITTNSEGSAYVFSSVIPVSGTSNTATGTGDNSAQFFDGSTMPAGFLS